MKKLMAVLVCAALAMPVAARRNSFMNTDSEEYKDITSQLLGSWEVVSFVKGNDGEQIGSTYKSAVFEVVAPEGPRGSSGRVVCRLVVSDDIVQDRAKDYIAKEEGMRVDSYTLVGTASWSLSRTGEIMHLDDWVFTVEIEGKGGEWLSHFSENERGFIETSTEVRASGGLRGMVGGAIMGGVSGASAFIPAFPQQANPYISDEKLIDRGRGEVSSGEILEMKSLSRNKLLLKKM